MPVDRLGKITTGVLGSLVTHTTFHKPSKVERARERLDAAVRRLETALLANPKTAAADADDAGQAERVAVLMQAMQVLEAENISLRNINTQVSDRLGSAIGRLKLAIGD